MKIEEQVLSREQMKHLQELGVDTSDASMCWLRYDADGEVKYYASSNRSKCASCPTYTVGDLIEKLPKHINSCNDNRLVIEEDEYLDYWWVVYKNFYEDAESDYFDSKSLLTALYNLLCWVAEFHKELLKESNNA